MKFKCYCTAETLTAIENLFLENLKSHKNFWEKISSENDILNIILTHTKISFLNTVTNFLKQIMKTRHK